jgi:hypothetical protein
VFILNYFCKLLLLAALLIWLPLVLVACGDKPVGQNLHAPRITSLTAEHASVYPLGNTRINCVADDPDGDSLNYVWTSTDGKIIGAGSQITWEAPRTYGDMQIMATVDDGKGNSVNRVVTVTVLVRDPSTCCR